MRILILMLVFSIPAHAQGVMSFGTGIQGNWNEISKCAHQAVPRPPVQGEEGFNDMTSKAWQKYSYQQQSVLLCRWVLAAYDAGWRDSGTDKVNPFPPVPSYMPGDFKELAK